MLCDMCGNPRKLYRTIVEGAELSLCQECSKFGKVVGVIEQSVSKQGPKSKSMEPEIEIMEILVEDYTEKIRKKRESMGLNQEQFAKKLNEKESLIQKIESGHFEPSIGLAKKMQSFLKIRLIESYKEGHGKQEKTKTDAFTIGDFIKIKEK